MKIAKQPKTLRVVANSKKSTKEHPLHFKHATILAITFWDFLMFTQIFLSPQVKRLVIISNKHSINELPNDLRLRILGN